MLCHAHALLSRGLEKLRLERDGHGMSWAWHGMCESNMAALCKSNWKDTIGTLSGMAGEQHGMCELAFSLLLRLVTGVGVVLVSFVLVCAYVMLSVLET
jgi:hypothetical protein